MFSVWFPYNKNLRIPKLEQNDELVSWRYSMREICKAFHQKLKLSKSFEFWNIQEFSFQNKNVKIVFKLFDKAHYSLLFWKLPDIQTAIIEINKLLKANPKIICVILFFIP